MTSTPFTGFTEDFHWLHPDYLRHIFSDPCFLLVLLYVTGQPTLRSFCERHQIYQRHRSVLKPIMAGYNVIMSLYSLVTWVWMAFILYEQGAYFAEERNHPVYNMLAKWFYYSKYVEFLDTAFLIVVGKPVSWLQYLHHLGAPLVLGIWYNTNTPAMWIIVLFNGFVHSIMYAYYACAILKIPFPMKKMLTSIQIAQFVGGLWIGSPYSQAPYMRNNPDGFLILCLVNGYVTMVLMLFLNFFFKSYIAPSLAKKEVPLFFKIEHKIAEATAYMRKNFVLSGYTGDIFALASNM